MSDGGQSPAAWYAGLGLVENAVEVSNSIRDGSWVDAALGGAGGSLDALAVTVDPLGSLTAWGVGWLLEHVRPLQQALDWLAGNPAEIATQAGTRQSISATLAESRQRYAEAVSGQVGAWSGAAGEAYRGHAAEQQAALDGISVVTGALAHAVEGAGLLVGLVREIVRDLIAQFVATLAVRLPQWLAAEGLTLGLATPVVAGQVASLVVTWVNRIQGFIRALLDSLCRLNGKLDDLAGILQRGQRQPRRLGHTEPARVPSPGPIRSASNSARRPSRTRRRWSGRSGTRASTSASTRTVGSRR